MKPDAPEPAVSERNLERAQEKAFSDEGAPPPVGAGAVAANAEQWGDVESRAIAPPPTRLSTDDPASVDRPADGTADMVPSPDMGLPGAAGARTSKAATVVGVCSLLSAKQPGRGC